MPNISEESVTRAQRQCVATGPAREATIQRPPRKRFAVWATGIVVGAALYAAAFPFVTVGSFYVSWAAPVLAIVYSPLVVYVRAELPGSTAYRSYHEWVQVKRTSFVRRYPPP
ncbi:MAG: hypothetical protein U0992_02370 [Planctomycetaceae bacterium]